MPADRGDRVEKALASRAHAVIVDLEDGVAPAAKAEARASLAGLLGGPHDKPVYVRVNAGDGDDLEAVAALGLSGVLVPKVVGPEDVPALDLPVHCLIESAAGVEAAFEIATRPGCRGDLARRVRPALGDRRPRGRARLGAGQDRQRRRRGRPPEAAAIGLPACTGRRRPPCVLRARPRARPPRPHRDPPGPAADHRAGLPADRDRARAGARDRRAARAASRRERARRRARRCCDARRRAAVDRDRRALRLGALIRPAAVARVALAAPELEAAAWALPRLVAPLHRRGAAKAALDCGHRLRLGGHARRVGPSPDGRGTRRAPASGRPGDVVSRGARREEGSRR